MPTYGEKQIPAGVDKSPVIKPLGTREMESRQTNVETTLRIDNCPYKGNPALNANR